AGGTEGGAATAGQAGGPQAGARGEEVMIGRVLSVVSTVLATILIAAVRCYQIVLRPILPAVCRFTPSCSEYFILAVQKYGPWRGAGKGVWRICRCHPFHPGGFDPP